MRGVSRARFGSAGSGSVRKVRRNAPAVEGLETRRVPSGRGAAVVKPPADGVDAMVVGDFNGDQIADIAVAGREGGHYVVTIYDSQGVSDAASPTGTTVNVLATMVDPLGPGVGPLSLAAGDFNADGISDLAVAASAGVKGQTPVVATYAFQRVDPTAPALGEAVTPVALATPFTPAGLSQAAGLQLAALPVGSGQPDELVVSPTGKAKSLDVYQPSAGGTVWGLAKQASLARIGLANGATVAAGPLEANGATRIVLGSVRQGVVKVLDPTTLKVTHTVKPFGLAATGGVRVAVVSAVGEDGAIVAAPRSSAANAPAPVLISPAGWSANSFAPVTSPGSGALVPAGGGWVYPRSTIQGLDTSFPYSDGPADPTVLYASTFGSTLVAQTALGSPGAFTASAADAYSEPILSRATPGSAFIPLEENGDMPGLSSKALAQPALAYPSTLAYHSPFSIKFPDPLPGVADGLPSTTPAKGVNPDGWGPQRADVAAPTVPATIPPGEATEWLRQRLLTAYSQAIGVAYQHHHDPFWQPVQGDLWNLVALGYQSLGVDCTNFTAWAYNDALGISMNSETATQAAISATNTSNISVPDAMKPYVDIKTIAGTSDDQAGYNALVSELEPGDILFINPSGKNGDPSDPADCTHAITWLGPDGVDANGQAKYLIIDSTGNAPVHYDSNGNVVKSGVEIREFGAPGSDNSWYFNHFDHALRILKS